MKSNESRPIAVLLSRQLFILIGSLFVVLAILGIFLPILPTTPLLLLAAACYAKGSDRFYNWLLNNRWFGGYIRNYREGRGIPLKIKLLAISLLWITIGCSAAFVVHTLPLRVILIVIAVAVTTHIIFIRSSRNARISGTG
jgi:uncharacterized membrane protein YbaN (DUF454 family)